MTKSSPIIHEISVIIQSNFQQDMTNCKFNAMREIQHLLAKSESNIKFNATKGQLFFLLKQASHQEIWRFSN